MTNENPVRIIDKTELLIDTIYYMRNDPRRQFRDRRQVNMSLVKQIHDIKNAQWYRYKGDIKLKHLFACKYVQFDIFSSNIIDIFRKINEEKLHASQLIMDRNFKKEQNNQSIFIDYN